ncbi:tripartite tricarboxylate transporter TctB family protein [Arthrobacter crystallopoietes]|uniref:tripartite tricarboxylate transporter TctB family protein n=1 Tax=Crystallibacter crystallopoietes TaxID=37928 RepID=UPI00111110B0|nr:tripartite tricarboxylate transporter TctB family protein [Arthrobacter crystallopoietes]
MSVMNQDVIAAPEAWWHRVNKADLVITLVFLAIFALGFVLALEWKPLAAYFPLGVSLAGMIASAVFLIRVLIPPRSADPAETNVPKNVPSPTDQEYEFFKSLTPADWLSTICWLGGFFVFLAVFGIFVALVVFTVGYLKFQAQKSWLFSGIYAAVLAGLVYVIFTLTLNIPLPEGVFSS